MYLGWREGLLICVWKQIAGRSEHNLRAKLTFSQELYGIHPYIWHKMDDLLLLKLNVQLSSIMYIYFLIGNMAKESGPVSMTFTIPMYNASRLQVKRLSQLAGCLEFTFLLMTFPLLVL